MLKLGKDTFSAIILGAFAVFLHLNAQGITSRFKMGVDSGFFPEIISGMLFVLALAIAVQSLLAADDAKAGNDKKQAGFSPRVMGTIAALAGAILAMPILGFILTATLFLFLQIILLTQKGNLKYGTSLVLSIIISCVVFLTFTKGFNLILPTGVF